MAKVFLSLEISVKTTSNKEKINKLNNNNIPFEEDSGEIYLISKTVYNSGANVGSREYDKPYAAFCMRLADSTESSIGMGEGSLDDEELAVLYEVFGDALEFQLTLSCNSDWENISANIIFNEVENKYYCSSEVSESSDEEEDYDEDYDEEWDEEELEEAPVPHIHLASFIIFYGEFLSYGEKKEPDDPLNAVKKLIYKWKIILEEDKDHNDSQALELYEKIREGIKTYEDGFLKIGQTISNLKLDDNQILNFVKACVEMYLFTNSSDGKFTGDELVSDDEINYSFYKGYDAETKKAFKNLKFLKIINDSIGDDKVIKFLLSMIMNDLEKEEIRSVELGNNMQNIFLKENFHKLFSNNFLKKTTVENEFIHISIEGSSLNISYNLDENDIDDSIFDDDEIPFYEIISELEEKLPQLKDFFTEDFEIIYFTYNSEYTSTMWQFDNNKLSTNSGWIGDFCEACESIEDEDERDNAQSEFVNENSAELKEGCPTEELLKAMREGLY